MVDARKLRNSDISLKDIGNPLAQKTRKNIVHTILAHPKESPSQGEIHYIIGKNRSTVCQHLKTMKEEQFVERLEASTGRNEPSVFYTLTEEAEERLQDGLLEEDKLEEYEQILENKDGHWRYTDEQIERYLETERPL